MRSTVKKTFEAAFAAGIDLIVQLKSNQPSLHRTVTGIAATTAPLSSHHSHDRGRNRDESRTVCVFDPAGPLKDADWQAHVRTIIRVERVVHTRNARTGLLSRAAETAFYLCNTHIDAERAAEAIRAHWRIETTSHYGRDVTFGEDRSRIRTNPGVFARLRSFAFNIIKANGGGTLRQNRYRAALAGFSRLANLVRL